MSKVAQTLEHPTLVPGVELLYWNGMPLQNAGKLAVISRHASRALAGMAVRPLVRVLPPQEE